MGCLTKCLKSLIVVCGLLLALIGVVLLAGGIVLLADSKNYIQTFFKNYYSIAGNFSGNTTEPTDPVLNVDFGELLRPFAIVLIVSGSVILVIALAGVCGICCSSHTLLVIHAVAMIVLIIVQIVLSILFFVKLFDANIKTSVKETLTEHYVDFDDHGEYSLAWNYLMIEHSCCGVDGFEDFNSSLKWSRDRSPSPSSDATPNATLVAPIACCKDAKDLKQTDFRSPKCASEPTNENSNWNKGCWREIEKVFEPYRVKVIGIVCAIVVAETVMVLIAIIVAWTLYKTSKSDLY